MTSTFEVKGKFLDQLEKVFWKEEIFDGIDQLEVLINFSEKIGYKRFTRSGKVTWIVEKNRPDLLDRLKKELVTREKESEYTTVSTVEKLDEYFPSEMEVTYPFREYQFYKWDNYQQSTMIHLVDDVVRFSVT
ncbi:hypothetical protein DWB85_15000 [Seongchinamella sediminis]|uniref:Uncharacterized protein n=1 Tax=Seongchinamella sediminis TaxID=2283635 RepID=A0A3L7DYC9_9GAMM|nr:hypothetical protein DWB85_15000 [Seongchinamella sediminis]